MRNRLECQEFNKTLTRDKAQRLQKEVDDDYAYAARVRQDGEEYVARQVERDRARREEMEKRGDILKRQVRLNVAGSVFRVQTMLLT